MNLCQSSLPNTADANASLRSPFTSETTRSSCVGSRLESSAAVDEVEPSLGKAPLSIKFGPVSLVCYLDLCLYSF